MNGQSPSSVMRAADDYRVQFDTGSRGHEKMTMKLKGVRRLGSCPVTHSPVSWFGSERVFLIGKESYAR